MDKTSKKIIKYMKETPDNVLFYYDEPYKVLNISEEEFFRCVRYLTSQELIEFAENQDGSHIGIMLSHKAVHSKELKRKETFNSLKKWFICTYLGGVVTGVTITLLSQYLMANGSELLAKLFDLLHNL